MSVRSSPIPIFVALVSGLYPLSLSKRKGDKPGKAREDRKSDERMSDCHAAFYVGPGSPTTAALIRWRRV
jgi:hypothetical protein